MVRQRRLTYSRKYKAAGEKPETIGTLTGGLTTPEAPDLQRKNKRTRGTRSIFPSYGGEFSRPVTKKNLNMLFDITILLTLVLITLTITGAWKAITGLNQNSLQLIIQN